MVVNLVEARVVVMILTVDSELEKELQYHDKKGVDYLIENHGLCTEGSLYNNLKTRVLSRAGRRQRSEDLTENIEDTRCK